MHTPNPRIGISYPEFNPYFELIVSFVIIAQSLGQSKKFSD
jgi:hypothetical protein